MAFLTLAQNQKRVNDKIRFVIQTRLQEAIDEYNASTSMPDYLQVIYPRTLDVGSPALQFDRDSDFIDQFPALSIYVEASDNIHDDLMRAQTQTLDYSIGVAYVADSASLTFNVQQAQSLSLIVSDTLEKFLPDSPGLEGQTIYRVDVLNTTNRAPERMKNDLWMVAYYAKIRVYVRSQMNYEPQHLSQSVVFKPFVESAYYPSGSVLFGYIDGPNVVYVATGSLNGIVDASIPAALTGTSAIFVSCVNSDIPSTVSNNTSYSIIYQPTGVLEDGTLEPNAGFAFFNARPNPMETGQVWNTLFTHPAKNTLLTYSIRWTIT